MTNTTRQILLRVNDELRLDAGSVEVCAGAYGPHYLIRPPQVTMFHQVLDYLLNKPDPPRYPSGSMIGREGVAAAALTLRWGSYLAVLLDRDKPVWAEVDSPTTSRINDDEMARINIEASAALAEWFNIYRASDDRRVCEQLVNRAVTYLPMPKKTSRLKITEFSVLAVPEHAARWLDASDESRVARARADAQRYPSRVLANALVHCGWRNGPVESIHAGAARGYPLDLRRMTISEERNLMAVASERLAQGTQACLLFGSESPQRPWSEQVLPYGVAERLGITPSCWTLTETSREVRLPA